MLKRLAKGALRRAGWELRRCRAVAACARSRRKFILDALDVRAVIDVGAACGGYGRNLRDLGFAGRIVSVEPRRSAFDELRRKAGDDSLWSCVRAALGAEDGEISLYVSGRETSSSILEMLPEHERVAKDSGYIGEEVVPLLRLDSVLESEGLLNVASYLKLDVQGYEDRVLSGGCKALRCARAVELELSLVPLYEDAARWRVLLDRLDDEGFRPISFDDVLLEPSSGFAMQVDCILIR
jgi:FkbM family methyltransferase